VRFLRNAAPLLVVAPLASALYARLSLQSVVNSDGANEALQGLDFWHGNVLLHGWWLAQDTFYLTDAPLYGLIARIQGLGPWVVHEGAGIAYAVALLAAALLARRGALLTVAVVAVPPPLLLQGQMHILGVAYVLFALLLVERWPGRRWSLLAFGLLLGAAMASDPLVTVLFAPPLVLLTMLRTERRRDLLPATLAAAAIGTALPRLITLAGGFTQPRPLQVGVAAPGEVVTNVSLLARSVLLVFRADVLDALADPISWVHLLAVIAVGAGLVLAAARIRSRAAEDLVPQVLLLACALDLAVFLFTTQPINLDSARFLTPFAFCGAVLAGRMLTTRLASSSLRVAAAVAAALLLLTLPLQLTRPAAPAPAAGLARWLETRGLVAGYGSYWDAGIVTLESRGKVAVRCVDGGVHAAPDRWFQTSAWFMPRADQPVTFVVFSPGERPANLDAARAMAAFGPPREVEKVGTYVVLVYSRDLRTLLSG
jgi:hypothetical protein